MTIKECIDIVDNIKPNQYSIREKVMWLSYIDEVIINEVLKTHEGYNEVYDLFQGYSEDKLSVELIVPSPYNRLYPEYLKMKIDSENGETARYNNSSAQFNKYFSEYKKHYNKTHMPLNLVGSKKKSHGSIAGILNEKFEEMKVRLYNMLLKDIEELIPEMDIPDLKVECKGYYIRSIDLDNKKIYLCDTKVKPYISIADNTELTFETPAYRVGEGFNIINRNHYILKATIKAISNNVVIYEGDLGFTEIYEDEGIDGHTFSVPTQFDIGVVSFTYNSISSGVGGVVAGDNGANFGAGNTSGYGTLVSGANNYSPAQHGTTGGEDNENTGFCTDVHGRWLLGKGAAQCVRGIYNIADKLSKFLLIVGNGKSETERDNAFTVGRDNNAYHRGDVYVQTTFDENGVKDKGKKLATLDEMTDTALSKINGQLNLKAPLHRGLEISTQINSKVYSNGYKIPSSINISVATDSKTNIVYDHITVNNVAVTMHLDNYTIAPRVTTNGGTVYYKLLMRTNQKVIPSIVTLGFFNESGNTVSGSARGNAEKATLGNGEWEQIVIAVSGMPANAINFKQIHLHYAGYGAQGSNFDSNAYFDIAGWAVFDDLDRARAYDLSVDAANYADFGYNVQGQIDLKANKDLTNIDDSIFDNKLKNFSVSRIATGSYVGTGTYGENRPNSLTFDFEPKVIYIYPTALTAPGDNTTLSNGQIVPFLCTTTYERWKVGTSSWHGNTFARVSEDRKTVYWYNFVYEEGARAQYNLPMEYAYLAIG